MIRSREDLAESLQHLEIELPKIIKKHPDPDEFWAEFLAASQAIEDASSLADYQYVRGRIDCMLVAQGLIPDEHE